MICAEGGGFRCSALSGDVGCGMNMDILDEIIKRRKADIARLGYECGCVVPKKRGVCVRKFLAERGAILEVKRASPSKGDISPNLDAVKTALEYAENGARAISVLTERNYFKGSIDDLLAVRAALDEYAAQTGNDAPAVLRKDFLCDVQDIDVSYRAGADAVLLIARILTKELFCDMTKKVRELGMSALIEVREADDIEKLRYVFSRVNGIENFVCGVNSRDLRDFSIDMLVPAKMFSSIKKISQDAKVVFESGIQSPRCAAAVSAMGFDGFLMGETAAKNPEMTKNYTYAFEHTEPSAQGKLWLCVAWRLQEKNRAKNVPLVKICGITRTQDALLAAELGADFLGFVFCKKSPRTVNENFVEEARLELQKKFGERMPLLVAVVTELSGDEWEAALDLSRRSVVDAIQFHGVFPSASEQQYLDVAHFVAASVSCERDLLKIDELLEGGEFRVLIDSRSESELGGTGIRVDEKLVLACKEKSKLWLAGGITAENVSEIARQFSPELIDISSGVEFSPGIKDEKKLRTLFARINGEEDEQFN